MKINQISISQYKSLGRDVKIRFLSNQIVLVGRNEAGKSNVLEALSRLRIFEDIGGEVLPLAHANRTLNVDSIEVAIDLDFNAEDVAALDGVGVVPDDERSCKLIIKRDAHGLCQTLGTMFAGIIKRDVEISTLRPHVQGLIGFIKKLNWSGNADERICRFGLENFEKCYVPNFRNAVAGWCVSNVLPHVSDKAARESYNSTLNKLTVRLEALYAEFRKIVPRFFRFYDEFELHSSYQLDEIKNPRNHNGNNLMGLDRYLGAIRLKRDDVIYALTNTNLSLRKGRQSQFFLKTERIMNEFNESYLKGSANVRIMPSFDGDMLSFAVVSDGLEDTVLMGERSAGLRWYLNAFFELKKANVVRNYVLLIDEPAIHMHVNAQREVLNLFNSLATGSRYLLYTTHSPYMIDANHMENVKAVIKENGVANIVDIHRSCGSVGAQDSWTPVCEALGVSLRYNVGPCSSKLNLICEGPSDACYVSAMLDFFHVDGDSRPNIIAAMGVHNIHNIAAILLGWGCKICALMDNDAAGESERKKMIEYLGELNVDGAKIVRAGERSGTTIESLISNADCTKFWGFDSTSKKLLDNKILNACMFAKQIKDASLSPDAETQGNFARLLTKIGIHIH